MARKQSRSSHEAKLGVLSLGIVITWLMVCIQPHVSAEEEAEKVQSNLAVIKLNLPNLYPESFDWDAKHRRFLVGSMGQGGLISVTEAGHVEDFVKDGEYAGAAVLGVTVDLNHNRVLAVIHKATEPPVDALAAYDLDSRERTLFVNLLEGDEFLSGNTVANDVAVDHDGNAYVTNSGGNSIWRVTLEGVKTVFLPSIPQMPIVLEDDFAKTCSSNGIVHHDGYLLVSQTNSGAVFRVRISNKEVKVVKITDETLLPGADGMALRSDGSLVVVSVDAAWLLSSRDSWRSATVVDTVLLDAADSTTSGVVNDLRVFTLHSHFPHWRKGANRDSFQIMEIKFPVDDHNNPLWLLAIVGLFAVLVLAWKFQMSQFNANYTKKRI